MAVWNFTADCSDYASWNSTKPFIDFDESMRRTILRVNGLLLASAILAVGIGIYGQRYRQHRLTRFIFLGATTLFLPIISSVVPVGTGFNDYVVDLGSALKVSLFVAKCQPGTHSILIVIWASLVQIIMINTSAIVSIDDREGQSIGPPFELFIQGVWTYYLGVSYIVGFPYLGEDQQIFIILEYVPFALIWAKIVFKYYAFEGARKSLSLGRNPRVVFGYMKHPPLRPGEPGVAEEDSPPPLLVLGEDGRYLDKQPDGYVLKDDLGRQNNGLVTIDRIWNPPSMIATSIPQGLKDMCLSFALFKLLRCRFARYKLFDDSLSKDTINFVWSLMLKDHGHGRVFGVIEDELSFLHDYYYSSLPISYSRCWLPIVGFIISLLSIGYCILAAIFLILFIKERGIGPQISCNISCIGNQLVSTGQTRYGSWYFDLGPIFLLFVLVVIAEVRDMASYICSNWTKVTLICRLINHASSQYHLGMPKWIIGLLLRSRCKFMKNSQGNIGQCSVLTLRPSTTPLLLWRLCSLLGRQKMNARVPAALKVCIISALRSSRNERLSNGKSSLRRQQSQVGERFLWACNGKGTSDTILAWHIATSILEVRYPYLRGSNNKIAATHLSRYCAYLVMWCPKLLPDDEAWSKRLYKDVKKDAERVLAGNAATRSSSTSEAKYQQVIPLLSENSKHEVLKNGIKLGKQLVDTLNDEEMVWKLLADFWSEMILYIAPSGNLKGHSEAIARGGELITLLWALLFHAGIVTRMGEDDGAASTSSCVV